jgi:hypothetical protein
MISIHKIKPVLYGTWKNSVPESLGLIEGPKQLFFLVTHCRNCDLWFNWPSKWVWLRLQLREAAMKHSEKSDITLFYQLKVDVWNFGHWPQYKTDNDAAEFVFCALRSQIPTTWLLQPQKRGHKDPLQNQLAMNKPRFLCSSIGRIAILWGPVTWEAIGIFI